MNGDDVQARENLFKLSQNTHYILNWNELLNKNRPTPATEQEEEKQEAKRQEAMRQQYQEYNDRYDLRKWEGRMQALNKIEYPLVSDREDDVKVSKARERGNSFGRYPGNNPESERIGVQERRREEFKQEINRIIAEGLVKQKLDLFRNKIGRLQKNISKKQQKYKASHHLPRSFMAKKSIKAHLQELSPSQQPLPRTNSFKTQLERQQRKYSMPSLTKVQSHRCILYDGRQY